jgi:hypothetical protein
MQVILSEAIIQLTMPEGCERRGRARSVVRFQQTEQEGDAPQERLPAGRVGMQPYHIMPAAPHAPKPTELSAVKANPTMGPTSQRHSVHRWPGKSRNSPGLQLRGMLSFPHT